MEEIDWYNVSGSLEYLLDRIDETSSWLCEQKFFRGCLVLSEKVVPEIKKLLNEARAHQKVKELAEESPEEGVEGEEEIPELEITAEQRARLMEEEL